MTYILYTFLYGELKQTFRFDFGQTVAGFENVRTFFYYRCPLFPKLLIRSLFGRLDICTFFLLFTILKGLNYEKRVLLTPICRPTRETRRAARSWLSPPRLVLRSWSDRD